MLQSALYAGYFADCILSQTRLLRGFGRLSGSVTSCKCTQVLCCNVLTLLRC